MADLIGHSKEAISVFSLAEAKMMKVPVEYMVAKMARLGVWPAQDPSLARRAIVARIHGNAH